MNGKRSNVLDCFSRGIWMSEKRIITRGDDCGANASATKGVLACANSGLLKNVSFMAAGTDIETAAELFRGRKDICMGIHFTIFSEWKLVKWHPVSSLESIPTLLNENAEFCEGPKCWRKGKFPALEDVEKEWNAQLDYLTKLGLDIRYGDTHMFPELYWDELYVLMEEWYREKGVLSHHSYYNPLSEMEAISMKTEEFWENLDPGQYFYLAHPITEDDTDMELLGNDEITAKEIIRQRTRECNFLTAKKTQENWLNAGCRGITYEEAELFEEKGRLRKWIGI